MPFGSWLPELHALMRGRSNLRQAYRFGPNAPYLETSCTPLVFRGLAAVFQTHASHGFDLTFGALCAQRATEIPNGQSRLVLLKPDRGMHSSSVKIKRTKVDA